MNINTRKHLNVNNLLWLIYVALLAVLLPHTAWAFKHFEIAENEWLAWALAFVFEAAVFAFTHNIKERIEKAHKLRSKENEDRRLFVWRQFSTAYLNIYGLGLLVAFGVSALANFSHAVEFARPMKVYAQYAVPQLLFELSFGAILPVMSLLFARVLAITTDIEGERDEALERAKQETEKLRKEVNQLRAQFKQYEQLLAKEKKERIVAAAQLWPRLPRASISIITGAQPGYVSEVLNGRAQ